MTSSRDADEGTVAGCLLVIGAISVAVGAGFIWGQGIGWLVLGGGCLIVALADVAVWHASWRRKTRP